MTRNHIRELTASGLHTSGGADSLALCGSEVAWDLRAHTPADIELILAGQDNWTCVSCAATLAELQA